MTLRPYRTDDLAAIADLFYRSVHTLCSGDYTKEQLDAWATGHIDEEAWDASFRARHTLVAEENGALLGEAEPFSGGEVCADLDAEYLLNERRRNGSGKPEESKRIR